MTRTQVSNYGRYAPRLTSWRDLGGYVPLIGAHFGDFDYPADFRPTAEEWAQYCREAQQAKDAADRDLAAWRADR